MFSPRVKTGTLVLEGLNAVATTIYYNYLFFEMRDRFGFTNLGNLTMGALNGLVYCVVVWFAGKFAQRHGYFFALRLGFGTMAVATGLAAYSPTVPGQVAAMLLCTLGMSLTWPTLEAIVSEQEPPARLKRLLGIYNVVWAGSGGLAYFAGGALYERWGRASIFLVPSTLHVIQVALAAWLARRAVKDREHAAAGAHATPEAGLASEEERHRSSLPAPVFLKLAWVANPFGYIAMNAMLPVIPKIAERFSFGPMLAGFFCSVWFFARTIGFAWLWHWDGWHYRFRWMMGAYVAMALAFLGILLGGSLWLLIAAQAVFGVAVGLLYYSSLFYSMDVGETKGEHGGFHEAALGAGICAGPAVGAVSLRFFPGHPNMHAWAVAGLLVVGLLWLLRLRAVGLRRH